MTEAGDQVEFNPVKISMPPSSLSPIISNVVKVESFEAAVKVMEARPDLGKEAVGKIWQMAGQLQLDEEFSSEVKTNQAEEENQAKAPAVMPEGWRLRICGYNKTTSKIFFSN